MYAENRCVKITIVIAVFNMADTIERAILSVLNQTYGNKELIVMDGGSTDGTVSVIERYSERLAYWTSEKDKGPSDAIAKALPHASGRLIGFLGADDWYEPDTLALVADAYEGSEADLLYGDMVTHGADGAIRRDLGRFRPEKLFLHGTQWLGAVCAFVKKELLEENYKKRNDVLLTDYLFFLRLYAEKRRFFYVPYSKPFTHFSIGGRTTTLHYEGYLSAYNVRLQIMREYEEFESYYKKIPQKIFFAQTCRYYQQIMDESVYKKKLKELFVTDVEYVLFGAGDMGAVCEEMLHLIEAPILGVVDNDRARWGSCMRGIEIKSPDSLKFINGVIIMVTSLACESEILQQLEDMGVQKKNKVLCFSDVTLDLQECGGRQLLDDAYAKGLIV